MFIIFFAYMVLKPGIEQQRNIRSASMNGGLHEFKNELLSTKEHEGCFMTQIKLLVSFYIICIVADWTIVLLIDYCLDEDALDCI